MKKTYISPELLVVKLTTERVLLEGSLQLYSTTVEDDLGGWVKEDNSPISGSNVWDEEW